MNNCPKCGNPLQVGTQSCPICGTNISASATPAPVVEEKPVAAPAPAPVVEAKPVAAPAPAPVVEEKPVAAPAPAPVVEAKPVAAPAPAPVVEATPVAAPAPAPVVEATPVAAPTPTPAEITPSAPAVQPIAPTSPVPSITATPATTPEETTSGTQKNTKVKVTAAPKKKMNKTMLVVLLIVIVLAGGGMLLMSGGLGGKGGNVPAPKPSTNEIASSSAASNGFKFKLQEGWIIQEDGNNVILTNSDETVVVKLENIKTNFSKINKDIIESYYTSNASFTETVVAETKISAKDAYLVNTKSGEMPVQIYYINGGTSLTLGATIIYQSKDSKEKYVASITELIGTLSYSDDSIKAISTIEMYSSVFGVYGGVFNHVIPTNNQTPTPSTPQTDPSNQNPPSSQNTNPTPEANGNTTS